ASPAREMIGPAIADINLSPRRHHELGRRLAGCDGTDIGHRRNRHLHPHSLLPKSPGPPPQGRADHDDADPRQVLPSHRSPPSYPRTCTTPPDPFPKEWMGRYFTDTLVPSSLNAANLMPTD